MNFIKEEKKLYDITKMIEVERLKKNLINIDDNIDNHPLLIRVAEIEETYWLPEVVIGDPQRMKQVLINMI